MALKKVSIWTKNLAFSASKTKFKQPLRDFIYLIGADFFLTPFKMITFVSYDFKI